MMLVKSNLIDDHDLSRSEGARRLAEGGLHILVIDDEHAIRRYLRVALSSEGHEVQEAADGEEALKLVVSYRPDIIVLDLGLPDMSGIEVMHRLREWSQIPVIILSVQDQDTDKIEALDAGADDFITKPFSTGELMARIRVAMRHTVPIIDDPLFHLGELEVDIVHRLVTVKGVEVQLTPTEYDLLKTLITHAGKVLTHKHLLREVWGVGYQSENHLLRVHMSNLRGKIEVDPAQPQYIVTEPGVGYRLRVH